MMSFLVRKFSKRNRSCSTWCSTSGISLLTNCWPENETLILWAGCRSRCRWHQKGLGYKSHSDMNSKKMFSCQLTKRLWCLRLQHNWRNRANRFHATSSKNLLLRTFSSSPFLFFFKHNNTHSLANPVSGKEKRSEKIDWVKK